MKYTFKKIYIEISNICNLNCSFCLKTNRKKKSLTFEEFKLILNKIKPYTKYLYFHVLGEPLLHPMINEFIDEAHKEGFFINITSNGFLINNLKTNNIRQLNISLHSYNEKYNKSLNEYLKDVYNYAINNYKKTYINYRIWVNSLYTNEIIKFLEEKYQIKINKKDNNIKLYENTYLNFDNEFIWPDNTDKNNYKGNCHALKDHIAILSNGVVTACCLDGNGKINFGSIFEKDIDEIINSDIFINMKESFEKGIRIHPLCKKCNFISIKKDK